MSVSGATPNYTYQWNTTPIQTTVTATGLSAGTYSCTITDSNLCDTTVVFIITEPSISLISNTINDTICNDDSSGSISLSVNGGTPPYNYLWSNNDTISNINNLTPDIYTVVITDSNGCIYNDTGYVIARPNPTALFSANTVLVNTATTFNNLSFFTPPLGGDSLTYDWNIPCPGLISSTTSLNSVNPIYTFYDCDSCLVELIVTDQYGCDNMTVDTVYNYCTGNANFFADSVCEGDTTHFTDLSTADTTIISWNWDMGGPGIYVNNTDSSSSRTTLYL